MKRLILMGFLGVAIIVSPGCLVTSSKNQHISGAYASPEDVSRVREGVTTQSEVEQILGAPSSKAENDDGSETWTWNWTRSQSSSGALILIAASEKNETVEESLHVRFRDGVAERIWRD